MPRIRKLKLVDPKVKKVTRHTPGSLAHAFFQQQISNATVFAFLQHIQEEDPRIVALLADYDEQPESERENVAIWDKLAYKHHIPVGKLYGKIAEAMLIHGRSLGFSQLAQDTPEVLATLGKAAKKEKNLEHIRLHMEASGVVGKNANGININFHQQFDQRQVHVGLPMLDETLKNNSRKVREVNEKMLTEGNKDLIIDTEIIANTNSIKSEECTTPK